MKDILLLVHENPTSGHFGYFKTLSRLRGYHWRNKSMHVYAYSKGCNVCKLNRDGRAKPFGEPEPLELPNRRWGSVSMNFVTHLPVTPAGFDSITTFVDRFSKRVHFITSEGTETAIDVAKRFFDNVSKHHGLTDSIVSDRDPKLRSKFGSPLMDRCGICLKMPTSRYPQTDGSTEIMNRMIGHYLRFYCTFHQTNWDSLSAITHLQWTQSKFPRSNPI